MNKWNTTTVYNIQCLQEIDEVLNNNLLVKPIRCIITIYLYDVFDICNSDMDTLFGDCVLTLISKKCYTSIEYLLSNTMMFSPKYETFCHYILFEAIMSKDDTVYEIIANSQILDIIQTKINLISSFKRGKTLSITQMVNS
jgi:hypothetical protein